jgi:hypothetical protein
VYQLTDFQIAGEEFIIVPEARKERSTPRRTRSWRLSWRGSNGGHGGESIGNKRRRRRRDAFFFLLASVRIALAVGVRFVGVERLLQEALLLIGSGHGRAGDAAQRRERRICGVKITAEGEESAADGNAGKEGRVKCRRRRRRARPETGD